MPDLTTSVIVRSKNEAENIGLTLDLVFHQDTKPDEVIVVDSGSTDGTQEIAAEAGARVIEIPAESFTFGGALNTGCDAASGDILVALSAHAFPRDPSWLTHLLGNVANPKVACTSGMNRDPDGHALSAPLVQDAALARRQPVWGYSNAAGGFRAELWREHPFREDLPATEDKEWALYWLDRGFHVVLDPKLVVDHHHSDDPLREQFRRAKIETEGFSMFLPLPSMDAKDFATTWWSDTRGYKSRWRARFSYRRMAQLLGRYAAERSIRRAAR